MSMVKGSQQMIAGFPAAGRAPGLAVHRDDPPLLRPRHGGLLRPAARQVIESIRVQALQRPPERQLRGHHARDPQQTQGLLVGIRCPFGDRGERARPGYHRTQCQAQDHRQPVAHTPAMPRISHLGQHPQQPRLLFGSIPGQLNQVADSRVNQ